MTLRNYCTVNVDDLTVWWKKCTFLISIIITSVLGSKGYCVDVNLSIMADTKWPRIEYMARFVSAVRSVLCRLLLPSRFASLTLVMPARRHWIIWVKVWQYNYKKITHYKSVIVYEKIHYIKPPTPNDVHICMCQYVHRCMWTRPSLVQIMPCRLLSANSWLNQCGLTCC